MDDLIARYDALKIERAELEAVKAEAARLWCVHCCARLVATARPHRRLQEAILACIARHQGWLIWWKLAVPC